MMKPGSEYTELKSSHVDKSVPVVNLAWYI